MIDPSSGPPSGPAAAIANARPDALPVLVVAAYPAVRAGLAALLGGAADLHPVAPDGLPDPLDRRRPLDAFAQSTAEPAAVVVDVGSAGEAAVDQLAVAYPDAPLVLLGGDPAVAGPGLAAGPVAYLAPDADGPTLVAAVRAVVAGLTVIDPEVAGAVGVHAHAPATAQPLAGGAPSESLSARERQVLTLVADGLPNKAIARELGISEHTVKFHVGSVLGKLGAGSRTEAVTLATRRGILAI